MAADHGDPAPLTELLREDFGVTADVWRGLCTRAGGEVANLP